MTVCPLPPLPQLKLGWKVRRLPKTSPMQTAMTVPPRKKARVRDRTKPRPMPTMTSGQSRQASLRPVAPL